MTNKPDEQQDCRTEDRQVLARLLGEMLAERWVRQVNRKGSDGGREASA